MQKKVGAGDCAFKTCDFSTSTERGTSKKLMPYMGVLLSRKIED
jgi:hypothetical protein